MKNVNKFEIKNYVGITYVNFLDLFSQLIVSKC